MPEAWGCPQPAAPHRGSKEGLSSLQVKDDSVSSAAVEVKRWGRGGIICILPPGPPGLKASPPSALTTSPAPGSCCSALGGSCHHFTESVLPWLCFFIIRVVNDLKTLLVHELNDLNHLRAFVHCYYIYVGLLY